MRALHHDVKVSPRSAPAPALAKAPPPAMVPPAIVQPAVVAKSTPPLAPSPDDVDRARRSIARNDVKTTTAAPAGEGATLRRSGAAWAQVADVAKVGAPAQVTGWNFDWDDNIFFMPTKIHLYDKGTNATVDVSTADFALVREQLGKPGPWKDLELRPTSLADFGDDPKSGRNHFVDDVTKALAASATAWKGPSWDAFVKACSQEGTAAATTIITARLHAPATIYAGLQVLQRLGLLKFLPKAENIFPVSNPVLAARVGGSAATPSAAKAIVMGEVLDRIQQGGLQDGARAVLDPDLGARRPMHLWGFSDDDHGNFAKAVAALSEDMKKGRWPDVKITVIFTGTNHPTERPHAVVLRSDGTTRPYAAAERSEVARLLRPQP